MRLTLVRRQRKELQLAQLAVDSVALRSRFLAQAVGEALRLIEIVFVQLLAQRPRQDRRLAFLRIESCRSRNVGQCAGPVFVLPRSCVQVEIVQT